MTRPGVVSGTIGPDPMEERKMKRSFKATRSGANPLRRLGGGLTAAALGVCGFAFSAQAEPCYLLKLTQIELNAAGGASDFAVPNGPNKFTITVKQSWPWSPALMNYAKFTFAVLPGTNPATVALVKNAGGVVKMDGNYAGPLEAWQANTVSTKTYGWPTPDPKSAVWPNDYPNQVWFETGPVSFDNCTVVRSQVATVSLNARDLLRYQGEVPKATCVNCPPTPELQVPGTVINPVKPKLQVSP
jgi:hypothetical protein